MWLHNEFFEPHKILLVISKCLSTKVYHIVYLLSFYHSSIQRKNYLGDQSNPILPTRDRTPALNGCFFISRQQSIFIDCTTFFIIMYFSFSTVTAKFLIQQLYFIFQLHRTHPTPPPLPHCHSCLTQLLPPHLHIPHPRTTILNRANC